MRRGSCNLKLTSVEQIGRNEDGWNMMEGILKEVSEEQEDTIYIISC